MNAVQLTKRGVVFDLFGTLVPCIRRMDQLRMLREMATVMNARPDDVDRLWAETAVARSIGGFKTLEESIEYIIECLEADPRCLHEVVAVRIRYMDSRLGLRREVTDLLERLKSLGARTAIVSNCSIEVPELWKTRAEADLFDAAVFSCTVGLKKPDPRIFRVALDLLGLPAESCLYVGDGDSGELSAATSLGMDAFLLRIGDERDEGFLRDDPEVWDGRVVSTLSEILELVS